MKAIIGISVGNGPKYLTFQKKHFLRPLYYRNMAKVNIYLGLRNGFLFGFQNLPPPLKLYPPVQIRCFWNRMSIGNNLGACRTFRAD